MGWPYRQTTKTYAKGIEAMTQADPGDFEDDGMSDIDLACPECGGDGMEDDTMPCPYCDGEGYQWWLV